MSIIAITAPMALAVSGAAETNLPIIAAEPLFGHAALARATAAGLPESLPFTPMIAADAASLANWAPTTTAAADLDAGGADHAIVVTSKPRPTKADPLAPLNAEIFKATAVVDDAITGPVAMAYKRSIPDPIRSGIRNFLDNLDEPVIFLNFMAQIKPGKSLGAVARLAINSTIGIGGLFDIAKRKPINIPRRPNGFANTLGYYGVKPGAYFYLPVIGPTTVRDLAGGAVDMIVLPRGVGAPFNKMAFTLPTGTVGALDARAEFEDELQQMRDQKVDLYRARRNFYLQRRQAEIDKLHGRKPQPIAPAAGTTPVLQPG